MASKSKILEDQIRALVGDGEFIMETPHLDAALAYRVANRIGIPVSTRIDKGKVLVRLRKGPGKKPRGGITKDQLVGMFTEVLDQFSEAATELSYLRSTSVHQDHPSWKETRAKYDEKRKTLIEAYEAAL